MFDQIAAIIFLLFRDSYSGKYDVDVPL